MIISCLNNITSGARRATLVGSSGRSPFPLLLEKARQLGTMALHGEVRAKVFVENAPKKLFFDNEPLSCHTFVRVFIDPDTLPVLRRVSVKFNRICKIHWKSAFKKACKSQIWFYGDNEHWDGILWERLYVATERNKELVMGVFGGSIDSRQAPLSRIDIHNTSLSHQNNINVSVDVVCGPEATKLLQVGHRATSCCISL